jgi:glycosyltransferase involved in cell wall biosynthesis
VDLVFTTRKAFLESGAMVAPFPISCVKSVPEKVSRAALGLPEEGIVMVSANRAQRYSQDAFWGEIISLLENYPNTYFVALGLADASPFIGSRSDLLERIITPGHQDDVMSFFAASDIYVDIFPSGGGSSVIEAITAGTPVVTFDQDLRTPYSVNAETLAEYVGEKALIAPNADMDAWRKVVTRLIEDDAFRSDMSTRMKDLAINFRADVVADRFFGTLKNAFLGALKAAA